MRVGGLIQVRLSSERLPGKAIAEIEGRPAIAHLIDRLVASGAVARDGVVVCTTTEPVDDPLVDVVQAAGAQVFRGSRDDIVDRIAGAAREHGFDAVVQADGDDICADPSYMARNLERLLSDESIDIVLNRGLPLGLASKAIRASAIERVHESYVPGDNSTAAFLYFTESGLCRKEFVDPVSPRHLHHTARLTLDYQEDLDFFRALFAELYDADGVFGIQAIVELLNRRPDLVEINAARSVEYLQRSEELIQEQRLAVRTADGVREIVVGVGQHAFAHPETTDA